MGKRNHKKTGQNYSVILWIIAAAVCFCLAGCGGYSNESLYPDEVGTVYVEMFENETFNRGAEYELTDALAKRIEAETPYKIVSNRDRADTVLSGRIVAVDKSVLTVERQTGRALEKDVELRAVVSWKNLKTGKLLIDDKTVDAMASYSEWQNQGATYASSLAANKLARKIVELMEKEW